MPTGKKMNKIKEWWNRLCEPKKELPSFRYCVFSHRPHRVGDILERPMESGKTGVFRVIRVDTPDDPGDQHFHTEQLLGYREDEQLPENTTQPRGFTI